MTVQASPEASTDPALDSESRPRTFAMVPRDLARDSSLSLQARMLYVILDDRQGQRATVRVGLRALMEDTGASESTVRRLIAELVQAGRISRTTTGRTSIYTVHNTARPAAQSVHKRTARAFTGERSTEQETLRNKQASRYRPSLEPPGAVDAAASTLDRQAFIEQMPAHLRPADTPRLARDLGRALARGWTLTALAAAIRADVPNPNAGPGMAMTALASLAQRPAREYGGQPPASTRGQALPQQTEEPPASPATIEAALAAMRPHLSGKAYARTRAMSGR